MNYGIKLWSTNTHLIPKAIEQINKGYYSFIEILIEPNSDITPFLNLTIPIVVHVAHERFRTNISDSSIHIKTISMMNIAEAISWSNQLNAEYIILHPGYGDISNAKHFINCLSQIFGNKNILIENMPYIGLNNERMVGSSYLHMHHLLENTNFGFCLDFGHAIKAAIYRKLEYKEYLSDFMYLKPKMFHLTDGHLNIEKDEHLELGTGEYDLLYLISLLSNPKYYTQDKTKCLEKFITIEAPGWDKNIQITI